MKPTTKERLASLEHRLTSMEADKKTEKTEEPSNPDVRAFNKMLENLGMAFLYYATVTSIILDPASDKHDGAIRALLGTKEEFNTETRRKAKDKLDEKMSEYLDQAMKEWTEKDKASSTKNKKEVG